MRDRYPKDKLPKRVRCRECRNLMERITDQHDFVYFKCPSCGYGRDYMLVTRWSVEENAETGEEQYWALRYDCEKRPAA